MNKTLVRAYLDFALERVLMLLLDETERSFEGLDALAIGGLMDGEGVLVGDGEALRHWHQVEMASTETTCPSWQVFWRLKARCQAGLEIFRLVCDS